MPAKGSTRKIEGGNLVKLMAILALSLGLASCHDEAEDAPKPAATISGRIIEINSYGQPIPNFSPADMHRAGIQYTDYLKVQIGGISLDSVPYVTSYNEVPILSPTYVDYNAKGNDYGFGMLGGDFHAYIGGEVGDTCIMTVQKEKGYNDMYQLLKSIYSETRLPGESAEEFANFRMVTTTNMGRNVLYRSSNPLNCAKNAARYAVADSLAQTVGIKTEIDLSDTPEQVETFMQTDGYASHYCPQLFKNGNTIALGMMANTFSDAFKQRMAKAVRFMIDHEPPYLIHCNEGKDRCGFVSMIFEALVGASLEEVQNDYMTTMINFYKIEYKDKSYELRQNVSIDRTIWLLDNEAALKDYTKIQWDNALKELPGMDIQKSAENYLKRCGLSDSEVAQLKAILTQSGS